LKLLLFFPEIFIHQYLIRLMGEREGMALHNEERIELMPVGGVMKNWGRSFDDGEY
jgi:hypothetical protein